MPRHTLVTFSLLLHLACTAATVTAADFLRGDSNRDGAADIGDAVCILGHLFGPASDPCKNPPCPDALDANDSGVLDVADAIYLLSYLFADGSEPPPPFPAPGPDPTADGLACGASRLLLNEVLSNPTGPDDGEEWIELVNAGNEPISLAGWTLAAGTRPEPISLPPWDIPPGAMLLVRLGPGENDEDFTDGSGAYAAETAGEVLDNEAEDLALCDGPPGADTIIDFLCWSSGPEPGDSALRHYAEEAGIWTRDSFCDLSFPGGELLRPGMSLGRDLRSTDTDAPDDWAPTGGADAFGVTPGAPNAGPLYSAREGVKLTQARTNLVFLHRGYSVRFAAHAVLEESQTADRSFVRAQHHFMVYTPDGLDVPFDGEGTFVWQRGAGKNWSEHIELTLHSPVLMETYRLTYDKSWEAGRIEQTIEEDLSLLREIHDAEGEEFEGDNPEANEPDVADDEAPPTADLTERIDSHALITITRTAADRVVLDARQHVEDDGLVSDISVRRETLFLSDLEIENWIEKVVESNVEDTITIRNHHRGIRWLEADSTTLRETQLEFLDYEVEVGGTVCSLSGPGHYAIDRPVDGRRLVHWMIPLSCPPAGMPFVFAGSGTIDHGVIDGEEVIHVLMQDDLSGLIHEMYMDGTPGAITGAVVCAATGALLTAGVINGWNPAGWLAIGLAVGAALASYSAGEGAQYAADELGLNADGAKPETESQVVAMQPAPVAGETDVNLVITDNKCIFKATRKVLNENGRVLSTKSYQSRAGRGSPTKQLTIKMHLRNRKPHPVTWTILVEVIDNAGNKKTTTHVVNIPPRSGR